MRRLIVVGLLLVGGAVNGGSNSWTVMGPAGGPIASVVFHPTEPTTALVGSARGVHFSLSDGAFWAPAFEGDVNGTSELVFDPSNPACVFARGDQIYRSDDAGRTFGAALGPTVNLVSMSIARNGVLYALNNIGRLFRSSNAGAQWTELTNRPWGVAGWPGIIAVDPSDSNIIYAAFRGVGIYKSADGGATWSAPLPGSPGTRDVLDLALHIAVDPTDGTHLFVATVNGLMRSVDRGATWGTQLAGTSFVWVGFDPAVTNAALAMSRQGQIERSLDRGDTWPANLRPPRIPVHEAYAAALSPTTPGKMLVATSEGPIFSADAGATFERRATNLGTGIPVALSAADDGTIYAALRFPSGIYSRSGQGWNPVNNVPLFDLAADPLASLAVAARNSSLLYAIDLNRRLMRSRDAGATWIGPHPQFATSPYVLTAIAVDPTNPMVAYLGESGAGLRRSADGGDTWQARSAGLPTFVKLIAISATNPNVIYVSALTTPGTAAVYRSGDAGLSWAAAAALPGNEVSGLTIDPTNPDIVYAVQPLALSRSSNGGATWSAIDFGLPVGNSFAGNSLLVDPVHPATLLAASSQPDLGFLRSVDGGARWERTALSLGGARTALGSIVLNPQRPGLVTGGVAYAGLVEYEINPDLGVTLTGFDNRLAVGGSSPARIAVQNHGPHAASAAHVSLSLPDFLTLTPPAGCALAARTLECDLPALHVGDIRAIDLSLTVAATPSAGFVTATLTGYERDARGANNVASVIAGSELQSNLAVTLSADASAVVGAPASIVATVTNNGPQASSRTYLQIEMPAGVFGQSPVTSQGSCGDGTAITSLQCDLGNLSSGGTATVTLRVLGNVAATHTISAEVSGANNDPVSANDTGTTTFRVSPAPPPTPPKKGGGGGLDWPVAMLLGLLLARRAWQHTGRSHI